MIDYIADYLETIRERRVYPNVHPGYLRNLTPDCAPVEPESWDHIMDDVENIIMPGVSVQDYKIRLCKGTTTSVAYRFLLNAYDVYYCRSRTGNRLICTRIFPH
jgi:hypothetical protein